MPAGQPSVRATSRSTSAGASPRPSRPLRNSAASAPVKRSSSARSSASWPCARSVPSGSSGSVRVAITSWTPGGRCAANQATAVTSEMRWKSSSTSATSPTSASALTSRGSTTSRTGAVTARAASAAWSSAGQTRHSASTTCDQRTTSSSSPSSSVTHATGRRAASSSRHAASSVDLPNPAGQATSVSGRRSRRRADSRSRAIVCAGTNGGCSLVTRRIGSSGRTAVSSTRSRA